MESVLVGNRTVTLEEFYKVSCLQAGVQLDTAASAGIKKSAGLAKSQKAPEAHNVEDNNDDAEEERSIVKKLSFSTALIGDVKESKEDEDLISAEQYVTQLERVDWWKEQLEDRMVKLKSSEKYMETFG